MREGVLLAEESPTQLLIKYQCSSLEEVFLNLSIQQHRLCSKTETQSNVDNRQTNVSKMKMAVGSERKLIFYFSK